MPTTAKICGLSTPETIDAAIAGGASHVGFVFFAPSSRDVSFDRAAELAARLPSTVRRVGVFVAPTDDLMDQAVASVRLDVAQLHNVNPAHASRLRDRFRIETWAAVAIRTATDLNNARTFTGTVDRLLYDAKTPEGAALPGGMGLRFDWSLLDGFAHPMPWALSGGLDAGNVAGAIARTGARLVDVSSGVESAPGVKDTGRIAAFLRAVAAA